MGDIKFSRTRNLTIISSAVKDDVNLETKIWKNILIANDAFQNLSKVLGHRKISLKINKWIGNCYVIFTLTDEGSWRDGDVVSATYKEF